MQHLLLQIKLAIFMHEFESAFLSRSSEETITNLLCKASFRKVHQNEIETTSVTRSENEDTLQRDFLLEWIQMPIVFEK